MGALYENLRALDAATRAREIVYLIRLGAEVHFGAKSLHLAAPGSPGSTPALTVAHTANTDANIPDMASWDFASMCTPPRKPRPSSS